MEMEMLELMRSRHSDFESLSSTPKILKFPTQL
jgi:hypothetical protein